MVKISEGVLRQNLVDILLQPSHNNSASLIAGERNHVWQMQHDIHVKRLVLLGEPDTPLKI
ncbi:MAG TPA: hypothetical protein VK968_19000 [Roseimicrobium sp.]|nr:hypothetical protein [Roseimicrobium sp.]